MTEDSQLPFRLRVESIFTIKRRGTVAVGVIEQGSVKVGDRLRVLAGDSSTEVVCKGVEGVSSSRWTPGQPASIGLLLPALKPAAICRDALIVAAG